MLKSKFVEESLRNLNNLKNDLVKNFYVFDTISSTNCKAKQLVLLNEDEGSIILSKIQTQGRGRFDRNWESPEGGVYLSIILRPDCSAEKALLLSIMSGVVISKTVSFYGLNPTIKWPNDVRVNNKKIAGILIESESILDRMKYVIVGLGINLNLKKENLSEKISEESTSILEETGKQTDYYEFIKKLLNNFYRYYDIFLETKYNIIINEWKNYSDTIGKKISYSTNNNQIIGKVIDINEFGSLVIKTDKKNQQIISSGECNYIKY
jgi:BirA family biotin operon repressor/biotin-[acetyl-CoA-carboxylase] ligase